MLVHDGWDAKNADEQRRMSSFAHRRMTGKQPPLQLKKHKGNFRKGGHS